MDLPVEELMLARTHERKLREATGVLEQARENLLAASERASSEGLRRQAAQARRHSDQLIDETVKLMGVAERLVTEARALHGERAART